jgi:osmoprotectant transport system ATP-binding protein
MQSTDASTAVPRIEFRRARRTFGDVVAVADLSLTVDDGEIFVLLGQSGCGKSTALQLVNRMLDTDGGQVLLAGRDVQDLDPVELRRGIGYVIQQIGLFPHRTVAQNVGTVCALVGWSRADTRRRVGEMLELVGLAGYEDRYPSQLSGGQQQRVGVARALAVSPPVLLMDEPFGALDPQIRRGLQSEFRAWVRDLGTTVLFVTHDVDEAVLLADRLAVMGAGASLMQVGTPAAVLGSPASLEVADFLGADRVLKRLSVIPATAAMRPVVERDHTTAAPRLAAAASAYDALLALVGATPAAVVLTDAGGKALGVVDWPALADLARSRDPGATSP